MDREFLEVNRATGVPEYRAFKFHKKIHNIALVIPILNERPRILDQLRRIQSLKPQVDVVIVDGGSRDGIQKYLESFDFGIATFLLKTGEGKLSAQLRVAFHYCISEGYEAIITMDGNGKDGVDGINKIKSALDSGYDFVQGSRFMRGGKSQNTPLSRFLAIRFVHAPITSIASRYLDTDSTNGFRGFSSDFLRAAKIDIFRELFVGYELLAYLPISAKKNGYKVTEVPVTRAYPSSGEIPTKIHGLGSKITILKILLLAAFGKYNSR